MAKGVRTNVFFFCCFSAFLFFLQLLAALGFQAFGGFCWLLACGFSCWLFASGFWGGGRGHGDRASRGSSKCRCSRGGKWR